MRLFPTGTPDDSLPIRSPAICSMVDDRVSDLLVGDLPAAMQQELNAHVHACLRCAGSLADFAALAADLKALPTTASPAKSWAGLSRALSLEPARRPLPFLLESLWLVAAGLLVAAALFARNEAVLDLLHDRLPGWLQSHLAQAGGGGGGRMDAGLRTFFLPGLFALFGAFMTGAAFPLLKSPARIGALVQDHP